MNPALFVAFAAGVVVGLVVAESIRMYREERKKR